MSAMTRLDAPARTAPLVWLLIPLLLVLAPHALRQPFWIGLAYGLKLPGRTLPAQIGEVHLRQCLEALARHGSSAP